MLSPSERSDAWYAWDHAQSCVGLFDVQRCQIGAEMLIVDDYSGSRDDGSI
jgi:hypothetical protein